MADATPSPSPAAADDDDGSGSALQQGLLEAMGIDDRPDGPPMGTEFVAAPYELLRYTAADLRATNSSKKRGGTNAKADAPSSKQTGGQRKQRQTAANADGSAAMKKKERERIQAQQRKEQREELRRRQKEAVSSAPPDDEDVEASKMKYRQGSDTHEGADSQQSQRSQFPQTPLSDAFPPQSNWTHSAFTAVMQAWAFCHSFGGAIGIEDPPSIDSLRDAMEAGDRSQMLADLHIGLLCLVLCDAVTETPKQGLARVLDEADNRGFDWRSWCWHLNYMTWPEIMRQFADCAGLGESSHGLSAKMHRVSARRAARIRKLLPPHVIRTMPPRFTLGSIKACCFVALYQAGPSGLIVQDVAATIHQQGLRDFSVLRSPETVVQNALARDPVFKKLGPSLFALKDHVFNAKPSDNNTEGNNAHAGDEDALENGNAYETKNEGQEELNNKYSEGEAADGDMRDSFDLTAMQWNENDEEEQDEHLMWVERLAFEDYHAFSVQERAAALEGLLDVCLDSNILRKRIEQRHKIRIDKARDYHKVMEKAGGKYFRASDESLREEFMLAPEITGETAKTTAQQMRTVDAENPTKAEALGMDRRKNRYWLCSENDGSSIVVYIELAHSGKWRAIRTLETLEAVESELDSDGIRERALLRDLRRKLPPESRTSEMMIGPLETASGNEELPPDEEIGLQSSEMPRIEIPRTEDLANQQLEPPQEMFGEQYKSLQALVDQVKTVAESRAQARSTDQGKNEVRCFWCGEPIDKRKELHIVASHETLQRGNTNAFQARAKKAFEKLSEAQGRDLSDCRYPSLPGPKLRRLRMMTIDLEAELPEDAMDMASIKYGREGWLQSAKSAESAQDVLTSLSMLVSAMSRRWLAQGYYTATLLPHRDKKGGGNPTSGKNVQTVCSTFSGAALAIFSLDGAAKYARGTNAYREQYAPLECLPVLPLYSAEREQQQHQRANEPAQTSRRAKKQRKQHVQQQEDLEWSPPAEHQEQQENAAYEQEEDEQDAEAEPMQLDQEDENENNDDDDEERDDGGMDEEEENEQEEEDYDDEAEDDGNA